MSRKLSEALSLLEEARQKTSEVVREGQPPAELALAVGQTLRALWPTAVHVCMLRCQGQTHSAILDEGGHQRNDLVSQLEEELLRFLDSTYSCASWTLELPSALIGDGWQLYGQTLGSRERRLGIVAIAIKEGRHDDTHLLARAVIAAVADRLSVVLLCEDDQRGSPSLEGPTEMGPADLSELTSIVAHQFNNHLNGILLQVAVLERGAFANAKSELQVIRQLGNEAANLVRRLQESNRRDQLKMQRLDLNDVVRHAAAQVSSAAAVELQLTQPSPEVVADPNYLRRLLKLLLTHCVAVVSPDDGKVVIRTDKAGAKGILQVEDTGPSIPDEAVPRLFDPFVAVREGSDDITLAICKLLARRLRANLNAENLPQEGVAFRIELDAPRQ